MLSDEIQSVYDNHGRAYPAEVREWAERVRQFEQSILEIGAKLSCECESDATCSLRHAVSQRLMAVVYEAAGKP